VRDADALRAKIGLAGQYAAVDENLTGFENLEMVGQLYHMPRKEARTRADELLERFDLTEAANRTAKTYSGGMRRRLDLGAALVARPPVLFLDEPTTGLDPRSRNGLWETIEARVAEGTTVLLTTQYLDEADRLADSIAVVDHGRVIAEGTSDQLKDRVGGERLEVHLEDGADPESALAALASMKSKPARKPTVNSTTSDRQLSAMSEKVRPVSTAARDIGSERKRSMRPFLTSSDSPSAVTKPPNAIDWTMIPGMRKST
jgi:ABC-2 type transport system ATP-binding protein